MYMLAVRSLPRVLQNAVSTPNAGRAATKRLMQSVRNAGTPSSVVIFYLAIIAITIHRDGALFSETVHDLKGHAIVMIYSAIIRTRCTMPKHRRGSVHFCSEICLSSWHFNYDENQRYLLVGTYFVLDMYIYKIK